MSERTLEIRITGKVQGVGYRAFASGEAARRGIAGWVRNEADGSVVAVVSGTGAALAEMVSRLRHGPAGAEVAALDVRSTHAGAATEVPPGSHHF